jgi:EAL domain-containing protein (putative c-di-GMP-specific phosphodiesterase class I)
LPYSLIKTDGNFVRDIHKDEENRAIVKMIIALSENLDTAILAKGVETKEKLHA